jgi:hypothetical protein
LNYINHKTSFYDGSKSTLDYKYAKCGENFFRLNCNGNGLTVKGTFEDTSGTTAITVTPSSPFKSFWKPGYILPGPNDNGFGVGINPNNAGANIFNESVLIHEALHGMTALYEDELQSKLGSGSQPLSLSIYIKNNVLSACPSFSGGGQQ